MVQSAGHGGKGQKKRNSLLKLLSSSATWAIIVVNCVNHWGCALHKAVMHSVSPLRLCPSACHADLGAPSPQLSRACALSRYFIYLNWMPTYFSIIFGLDIKSSSYFSFLPWTVDSAFLGAIMKHHYLELMLASPLLTDRGMLFPWLSGVWMITA